MSDLKDVHVDINVEKSLENYKKSHVFHRGQLIMVPATGLALLSQQLGLLKVYWWPTSERFDFLFYFEIWQVYVIKITMCTLYVFMSENTKLKNRNADNFSLVTMHFF